VEGFITDDHGQTTQQTGQCERDGKVWIEGLPLSPSGRHQITVVTTDAAGNSSVTNIVVNRSEGTMTIDPVANPEDLWKGHIDLSGYSSVTNCGVFANGVRAEVLGNGRWVAKNVPVNKGGTASLVVTTGCEEDGAPTNAWRPDVVGSATNNLAPVLSIESPSTNFSNHCTIRVGLTNLAGAPVRRQWALPPATARVSLRLFDQANREISNNVVQPTAGLTSGLNIHHLRNRELKSFNGMVDFFTNAAICTAAIQFDQHFPTLTAGDYRLEVTLHLYRIDQSGELVPHDFPPVITNVRIADHATEMASYLDALQRKGELAWSTATNSLVVGLQCERFGDGVAEEHVVALLRNPTSNNIPPAQLLLPELPEQFVIELYDAAGQPVAKTSLGSQSGQKLSWDGKDPYQRGALDQMSILLGVRVRPPRLRSVSIDAHDTKEVVRVKLRDYFEINEPGKYQLRYQQRVYQKNTNSTLRGLTLPAVVLPIIIEAAPIKSTKGRSRE
jgi:hypothetical protein